MAKSARELPPMHRLPPVPKQRIAGAIVGAKQLARHLDLTHPRIRQLADEEHVLERLPSGKFNQDDCRVKYLRWLRAPERRVQKSQADNEFTQAKAELIRIRIAEKQKVLMLTDEAMEVSEKLIGTMLTAMCGMAPRVARCAGNSVAVRREVDAIVYETRVSLANTFNKFAEEAEKPPLELPPLDGPPSEQPLPTADTEEDVPA
jgi:hypothetical protein